MARVSATSVITPVSDGYIHGKQYAIYHLPCGDIPRYFENLIRSASKHVVIWDPYFNSDDARVLSLCGIDTNLTILTYSSIKVFTKKWDESLQSALLCMKPDGYRGIVNVGCIDKGDIKGKKWGFHDRWLIIDDDRYFIIGSSVSNNIQHVSKHDYLTSGILELKEDEDKMIVKDMFDDYWKLVTEKSTWLKKI